MAPAHASAQNATCLVVQWGEDISAEGKDFPPLTIWNLPPPSFRLLEGGSVEVLASEMEGKGGGARWSRVASNSVRLVWEASLSTTIFDFTWEPVGAGMAEYRSDVVFKPYPRRRVEVEKIDCDSRSGWEQPSYKRMRQGSMGLRPPAAPVNRVAADTPLRGRPAPEPERSLKPQVVTPETEKAPRAAQPWWLTPGAVHLSVRREDDP